MRGSTNVEVYTSVQHPEWGEQDVAVECRVYPGSPGKTWGPPENCYPPEPAEVEIETVTVDGGEYDGRQVSWKLVKMEDIEANAVMAAEEKAQDEYEAAMEAKAEAMRDDWDDYGRY